MMTSNNNTGEVITKKDLRRLFFDSLSVSASLNYEKQMKAYLHAMKHITGDDFQKDDVQSIEYLAHG